MTRYLCKCGAVKRKSTNADNTGNRDTSLCQGCPYLLPWGEYAHIEGEGYQFKVKGHECRMSQELQYNSCFIGKVTDKCTCAVVSLDYEFLEQISDWIRETYPGGELSGGFSREHIRATDFSNNGRYRYSICCSLNKAGMAAKAALKERFFKPNGDRKDMTPEEEEHKVLASIENGKKAARMSAKKDRVPAENEVWVSPTGEKYRIGQITVGKKPHWHTERMEDGEWKPGNSSFYEQFENAQGEFGAWIRRESLVPEEAGTQENLPVPSESALAAVPDAQLAEPMEHTTVPAFDYSGLDERTVSVLRGVENTIRTARKEYIIKVADAVGIAHDELVRISDKRNNQYTENTFISWCASVGLSKTTAYQLLQVSNLLMNSTPNEQKILEQAQPSLLYAAARPSAPAELVEQVKSGDITTHKQYQELLAEKKAAEKQVNILKSQNEYLQKVCEDEVERAETAEKDNAALKETADLATTEAALARASEETMRSQYTELINEQNGYLARIAELESRPIEVAVQPPSEEQLAAIRQQADEEAQRKYDQLIENVTKDRKSLQARTDALSAQLRELKKEARMPGIDTVYPMCRDYARSIATFQSTFLMVGAGLDQKEFADCAHELMDAAQELCCVIQATMDDRSRATQKEDDLF